MTSKHPLKVFISYASGDRAEAQKLHAYLASQGTNSWIDTENLLPGQDVLTVSSMAAKIEALQRGLGCGFIPEAMVRSALRRRLPL